MWRGFDNPAISTYNSGILRLSEKDGGKPRCISTIGPRLARSAWLGNGACYEYCSESCGRASDSRPGSGVLGQEIAGKADFGGG